MRKSFFGFCFIVVAAWMANSAPWVTQIKQQPAAPFSTPEKALRMFLQNYVGTPSSDDKLTRYSAAFVDLDGDGTQEAIVYIKGPSWCGSGGCVTLILARKDSSYRVVTKITITRTPIRVLTRASKGWRNLAVVVAGGGIQPGYEAELRFDGKTYPSNPSVPPARPLHAEVAGEVVVPSSEKGTALYP